MFLSYHKIENKKKRKMFIFVDYEIFFENAKYLTNLK